MKNHRCWRIICWLSLLLLFSSAFHSVLGWPTSVTKLHFKSITSKHPTRRPLVWSPSCSNVNIRGRRSHWNDEKKTHLAASTAQNEIQEKEDDTKTHIQQNGTPEKEADDMNTGKLLKEIAAVGIPALGGILVDPLMSLIDTACVGQISSLQLAALAPCTSIFQYFFVAFYFLPIATTNLVASNSFTADGLSQEEVAHRREESEKAVSCATFLAVISGVAMTSVLLKYSDGLLALAGCSSVSMMTPARNYLRIRALGLPFAMVGTVLQGASLGQQDSMTPLKIFGVAGLLNLIGDIVLTLQLGWGTTGAAVATTASQVFAGTYFLLKSIMRKKESTNGSTVQLTWKGWPSKKLLKNFATMAGTVGLRSISGMSGYSLMTKVASSMGSLSLAAHQVTLQVWWLLSLLVEPTTAAAQSLVARDIRNKPWRVTKLIRILFGVSLAVGCVVALLTGLILSIPWCSSFIVADKAVQSILFSVALPAAVSQIFCAMSYTADSVAVGCGEFWYLPINQTIAFFVLTAALQVMKRFYVGLPAVWISMVYGMISRCACHLSVSRSIRKHLLTFGSKRNNMERQLANGGA